MEGYDGSAPLRMRAAQQAQYERDSYQGMPSTMPWAPPREERLPGLGSGISKGATPAGPSLRDQRPRPRRLPRAHSPLFRLALQYCYVHRNRFRQIPLRAMRNAGIPVRVRQVLLPLPDGSRSSPVPGRAAVLRALPRRLRLQNLRLESLPQALRSPPLPGTPQTLAASHPKSLPPLRRPQPPAEFAA